MCAGIINPITGKRLILTEDYAKFHKEADVTYRELESNLAVSFYHEKDIVRFYDSPLEHKNWSERKDTLVNAQYIKAYNPSGLFNPWFHDRYGSLVIRGNVCNVPLFIKTFGEAMAKDQIIHEPFEFNHLKVTRENVVYKDICASKIIFCEGFKAQGNPYFQHLPFKHAKGEILTLDMEGMPLPDKVFNFGKWVFPSDKKSVKAGTTFHWEEINDKPTEEGKNEILSALKLMVKFSFTVTDHQAGVRPVILDLSPVLGVHPRQNRVGIFNGLGAKGVLYAPWLARRLTDHLIDQTDLETNININRFSI